MMGGVQGSTSMTAFALIALEECKCNEEELLLAKKRAIAYLETHMGDVNKPLSVAIVAYALVLNESPLKQDANDKLLSMAKYNTSNNWMYWNTGNSAQDIETAGYGLLTQIHLDNMTKSKAIVNWLKTKQLQSGSFKSTQDTVIALQSLSEYAIRAQLPSTYLFSNISHSKDPDFHMVLKFDEESAFNLHNFKIDNLGGHISLLTSGQGVGSLTVKLRYNVLRPTEEVCKFDVTVNVTHAKNEGENSSGVNCEEGMPENFPEDLVEDIKEKLEEKLSRTQNEDDNTKVKFNISLCVKYLGSSEAGMSIMDVGVFSGFEPVAEDLIKLESDPTHLISRFEKSSTGVVFYLDKVPFEESYCFSFHVTQRYIVGNTQMRTIQVYDYYNPDETCTKFYSPQSNSSLIRSICEGGVCECAEGVCPPKEPFSNVTLKDLESLFCKNYDYVWKGKLNGELRHNGGFLNISFKVDEVVKAGIEKAVNIEGETRTLLARENCETANLIPEDTYLILGKDGQAYMHESGEIRYRYFLEQTSIVYLWTSNIRSQDQQLQLHLNHVTKTLKEHGCQL